MAMAAKHTQVGRSKKQKAAEHKRAVAGGAASAAKLKKFGPTKAQKAAGKKFAAGGRAARSKAAQRKKAHLKPLPVKHALMPGDVSCCAAEAVADSLRVFYGVPAGAEDVLELYFRVARHPDEGAALSDVLRAAEACGLAGWYPRYFPSDPHLLVPGSIAGFSSWDGGEPHAALAAAGGAWTWDEILPWPGVPDEAWTVRWVRSQG
jgi:hypothetical protein